MPVPSPSGFVRRWPAGPTGGGCFRLLRPGHSRRGQRSRPAADPAALRRTDLEPAAPLGYQFAAAGLRSAGVQPGGMAQPAAVESQARGGVAQ